MQFRKAQNGLDQIGSDSLSGQSVDETSADPRNERAEFYGDLLVSGNTSLLAFNGDELVGCRTGDIHTYEEHLAVSYLYLM